MHGPPTVASNRLQEGANSSPFSNLLTDRHGTSALLGRHLFRPRRHTRTRRHNVVAALCDWWRRFRDDEHGASLSLHRGHWDAGILVYRCMLRGQQWTALLGRCGRPRLEAVEPPMEVPEQRVESVAVDVLGVDQQMPLPPGQATPITHGEVAIAADHQ